MHGNTSSRLKGSGVATRWLYRMIQWPPRSGVADPSKPSVSKVMKESLSVLRCQVCARRALL